MTVEKDTAQSNAQGQHTTREQNPTQNQCNVLSVCHPHPTENCRKPEEQNIHFSTKQYRDIIQIQEPSTSKNISVKTEIRINILSEPESKVSNDSTSQISLNLIRAHNQKAEVEEESYHTIENCLKDKNVNTNVHYNERVRTLRGEAPPPYEPSQPPPAYSSVQGRPNQVVRNQQPQNVIVLVERTQRPYNAQRGPTYNRNDPDPYSDSEMFNSREVRHKFVQKVYAILSLQLLFTFGFVVFCVEHVPTRTFVRKDLATFICFAVFWFILYIALMCYRACRRIVPLNYILLVLFTCCQSYVSAAASVYYDSKVVYITLGATAGICLIVSFVACQNWFDITKWGFILALAGIVVMCFGLIAMLVTLITGSNIVYLIFAGLATGLFTIFLLYDTQCILGGRRVETSPEEYIFGVLTLYVDICLIFFYMLNLVNACS